MVVIVKRFNIALILFAFMVSILVYGLNSNRKETEPVTGTGQGTKTILIDAGHGGEDPGAVSPYSGFKEKEANLYISLRLKELLEAEGYKIIMTREEDKLEYTQGITNVVKKRSEDLLRRKRLMDTAGADVIISIHQNKISETQYYGAQAFSPKNSPESMKLAQSIQKVLKETVDPTNKRDAIEKKEDIIILRNTKTTTVMVECGFLSNAAEEKKLITKEYQDKLAEAIKNGVVSYFAQKANIEPGT